MWWCVTTVNRMLRLAKSPWLANPACVTIALKTAIQSTESQPQKSQHCPEKSTHDISKKVNAARSSVNLLTSVLVPTCTAFQNWSLHQFSAYLDHALTKVNAGQTCVETLAAVNSSFFPRVNWNCFQGARTKSEEEMMCEDEMSEKVLQRWLYLYQSLRCVTHLLGV